MLFTKSDLFLVYIVLIVLEKQKLKTISKTGNNQPPNIYFKVISK